MSQSEVYQEPSQCQEENESQQFNFATCFHQIFKPASEFIEFAKRVGVHIGLTRNGTCSPQCRKICKLSPLFRGRQRFLKALTRTAVHDS
jgi:hypothetical protein